MHIRLWNRWTVVHEVENKDASVRGVCRGELRERSQGKDANGVPEGSSALCVGTHSSPLHARDSRHVDCLFTVRPGTKVFQYSYLNQDPAKFWH